MPLKGAAAGLARLWNRDIWQSSRLTDHSPRAGLRPAPGRSTTATTFSETRTLSRAADLSFSSMLGLGPLIAIAMLVPATSLLGDRNPNLAVDALNRLITFVAPQLDQYESVATRQGPREPRAGRDDQRVHPGGPLWDGRHRGSRPARHDRPAPLQGDRGHVQRDLGRAPRPHAPSCASSSTGPC